MLQYNFNIFSPPEFEDFSRDLLQEHFQLNFESFKEGKDGGIDFRHSINYANNIIVQCKRYANFEVLFRDLKKEKAKVEDLAPKRYILCLSIDLNPEQKSKICNLFNGYVKNNADIMGSKDLNNVLSKFPNIEKKYYKLWVSSTNVLHNILHGSIFNKSDFTESEILKSVSLYVENDSLGEAHALLSEFNYVVISGIPGIGKTTLAKMIIFNYLNQGYKLIQVSRDIDEAENAFVAGERQVFFYDDFLGKIFLENKLQKNEESRIMQFLRKVKRDTTKKIIFTTREYILQQAKSYYDEFEKLDSCIIDLKKYNERIKAQVLYNHLFFSDVPQEYVDHLIQHDNYLNIIHHRNYSPRIVEYLTFDYESYCDNPQEYYSSFIKLLENPKELWKKPFEVHISLVSRYFLRVLFTFNGFAHVNDIKIALERLIFQESKKYTINYDRHSFESSLYELNKSFINIDDDLISFQNPSIQDFLRNDLSSNSDLVIGLIKGAHFFDQFFSIFSKGEVRILGILTNLVPLSHSVVKFMEQEVIQRFDEMGFSTRARTDYSLTPTLNKLAEMKRFFSLNDSEEFENFYIKKLQEELDKESHYFAIKRAIDLIAPVSDKILWNKDVFIEELIDSITDIDDADDVSIISDNFPHDFDKFHWDIELKLDDAVDDAIFRVDKNDVDEIKELKEKIQEIQRNLNMRFTIQIMDLDNRIHELEDNLDSVDDEDEDEQVRDILMARLILSQESLPPLKDAITSIFRSLKK